jgi:putative ABC transport system substrate-binding protein
VDRREFLGAVSLSLLAAPLAAEAQGPGKVPRIGYAMSRVASQDRPLLDAARQGLRDLGYVEGQDIALEVRWAEGRYERFPALVAELIGLNVDVLVVVTTPGALAAKNATRTIPVVMIAAGDPVESGLVASLARPGGNLTGLSILNTAVHGKRLELLKETLPSISRVAVLTNPGNPIHAVFWKETQAAARTLGLDLQSLKVRTPEDFDNALTAAARGRAEALLAFDDSLTLSYRTRLVTLAAKRRLPAMYGFRDFPDAGGLLSYGTNLLDQYRRTATFVHKILKGAKPADLPVEQPTKFELVINLKTAKALSLTIPPAVLARADEVIQ